MDRRGQDRTGQEAETCALKDSKRVVILLRGFVNTLTGRQWLRGSYRHWNTMGFRKVPGSIPDSPRVNVERV